MNAHLIEHRRKLEIISGLLPTSLHIYPLNPSCLSCCRCVLWIQETGPWNTANRKAASGGQNCLPHGCVSARMCTQPYRSFSHPGPWGKPSLQKGNLCGGLIAGACAPVLSLEAHMSHGFEIHLGCQLKREALHNQVDR